MFFLLTHPVPAAATNETIEIATQPKPIKGDF